jgi:hypothetical protein
MRSVPTAAIIPRNPHPTSAYGHARPCRMMTVRPKHTPFPQDSPPQTSPASVPSDDQEITTQREDLDFPITIPPHAPRLG